MPLGAALLGLLGCAARSATLTWQGSSERAAAGKLRLYRLGSGHVFVEAGVIGLPGASRERMLFLVDTGARNTALDIDVAERLDLPLAETGIVSTGALGAQDLRKTRLTRLELPAVATLHHWPIHVLQITLGLDGDGALPVAGVIGTDLLERFDVLLDVPGGWLHLNRPGARPPPTDAVEVPFRYHTGEVLVDLRVGSDSFVVEVDSGADLILLYRRGDAFPEGWPVDFVIGGAGDDDRLRVVPVREVALEEAEVGTLRLPPLTAIVWEGPMRRKDGLLGMPVLAHRAVHFDFRRRRLRFGPEHRGEVRGPEDYRDVLERRLRLALAADADDYQANLRLGMLLGLRGEHDEARRLLGWASTLRPREAEPLRRLAIVEWESGRTGRALDAATRAYDLARHRSDLARLVNDVAADMGRRPPPLRPQMLDMDPMIE